MNLHQLPLKIVTQRHVPQKILVPRYVEDGAAKVEATFSRLFIQITGIATHFTVAVASSQSVPVLLGYH